MAKIYAPNKEYTGMSAGVSFCNGMGETETPYLMEWFRRHGYRVEVPVNVDGITEEEVGALVEEDGDIDPEQAPGPVEKKKQAKKAGE